MHEITIQLLDLVKEAVPWAVAASTLLQISPIQINPWSWLAKTFGKAINQELLKEIREVKVEVSGLKEADAKQEEERQLDRALGARRRILQFADEVRRGASHSQEHFNNIFEDIKFYHDFCCSHPDFKNDKALISIERIEGAYKKCLDDNSFL